MSEPLQRLWVYLSTTPLLWLVLTLLAFEAGSWLYRRSGFNPLLNAVLVAVALLGGLLLLTGTRYTTYFSGAQFIHFLLGPATVALAVPLYRQVHAIRKALPAIVVSLLVGALTAIGTALGIAWALGGSRSLLLTLAPKSATTPIAMGVAEQIGGMPSLAAIVVVVTGIIGAAFGGWVLDRVGVRDEQARGMALGLASHGLGTARAMQMGAVTGAFAGLAMGLNGLVTAVLVPVLVRILE